MAGGGQAAPIFGLMARRIAFTMAEILLSLTIIGVVAAITLPSLTGNINERTWNTQRKALFSRISQAVALMPQVRGYGDLSSLTDDGYGNKTIVATNNAEVFVTSGLSKVLKINNICDNEHLEDCGIPSKINAYGGSEKIDLSDIKLLDDLNNRVTYGCDAPFMLQDVKATAFETANGESLLFYYNPLCRDSFMHTAWMGDSRFSPVLGFCGNIIYDLNGKRGPNTVGKDIGVMGLFYSGNPLVVAPNLVGKAGVTIPYANSNSYCKSVGDSRLVNLEEMVTIFVNDRLFGSMFTGGNTAVASGKYEGVGFYEGHSVVYTLYDVGLLGQMRESDFSSPVLVMCTKRD